MVRSTAWLAAALVVAGTGCASMRASMARRAALRTELDALRLEKPLDEVWPEVQHLLAERDYPLLGKDAVAVGQPDNFLKSLFSPGHETRGERDGGRSLETGWGDRRRRYRAEGLADARGCRVVFTAIDEDLTTGRGELAERDPEMELALVRRVDRAAADGIEARLAASLPGSRPVP
jgi:hypothetical protein